MLSKCSSHADYFIIDNFKLFLYHLFEVFAHVDYFLVPLTITFLNSFIYLFSENLNHINDVSFLFLMFFDFDFFLFFCFYLHYK